MQLRKTGKTTKHIVAGHPPIKRANGTPILGEIMQSDTHRSRNLGPDAWGVPVFKWSCLVEPEGEQGKWYHVTAHEAEEAAQFLARERLASFDDETVKRRFNVHVVNEGGVVCHTLIR